MVRDAELGRRLADRRILVCRRDGDDAWVLVLLEVQGRAEPSFPAHRLAEYRSQRVSLPPGIEARMLREVEASDDERTMPHITSVERHG